MSLKSGLTLSRAIRDHSDRELPQLVRRDLTILTRDRTDELGANGHRVRVVPLWRWLLGCEPQG